MQRRQRARVAQPGAARPVEQLVQAHPRDAFAVVLTDVLRQPHLQRGASREPGAGPEQPDARAAMTKRVAQRLPARRATRTRRMRHQQLAAAPQQPDRAALVRDHGHFPRRADLALQRLDVEVLEHLAGATLRLGEGRAQTVVLLELLDDRGQAVAGLLRDAHLDLEQLSRQVVAAHRDEIVTERELVLLADTAAAQTPQRLHLQDLLQPVRVDERAQHARRLALAAEELVGIGLAHQGVGRAPAGRTVLRPAVEHVQEELRGSITIKPEVDRSPLLLQIARRGVEVHVAKEIQLRALLLEVTRQRTRGQALQRLPIRRLEAHHSLRLHQYPSPLRTAGRATGTSGRVRRGHTSG